MPIHTVGLLEAGQTSIGETNDRTTGRGRMRVQDANSRREPSPTRTTGHEDEEQTTQTLKAIMGELFTDLCCSLLSRSTIWDL